MQINNWTEVVANTAEKDEKLQLSQMAKPTLDYYKIMLKNTQVKKTQKGNKVSLAIYPFMRVNGKHICPSYHCN
jgi:replication initiation and membrane attachment protein DnaB